MGQTESYFSSDVSTKPQQNILGDIKTKVKSKMNQKSLSDLSLTEQTDNAHRHQIAKLLFKQPILASHHLLQKQNNQRVKQAIKVQQKIADNKICSTINNRNNSSIEKSKIKKASKTQFPRKPSSKCSIVDMNRQVILDKLNLNQNKSQNSLAISSFKSYVMSDKSFYNDYEKLQIKIQDFIILKKQPIKKFYLFQQKIGSGSYGDVYKAIDKNNTQLRAIKMIKKSLIQFSQKKQFFAQLQILRQLDHPNIIKLYQIFEDRRFYYVVTQYCVGGSIIDLIVSQKNYNQHVIKIILRQILSALNYMHSLKIAHRDIKLQNIVFMNKLSESFDINDIDIDIKIIDFGTATKLQNQLNVTQQLFGTTSYLAPQIINGCYNQKCDVWSAGVILYILMTGKSPFKSKIKEQTLDNILHLQLTFDSAQWSKINKKCIQLISKMLNKSIQSRISAFQALNHSWFMNFVSQNSVALQSKDILPNLSKYYRGNNFISKIQAYLTLTKVNQKERKRITQIFKLLDKNNDGMISIEELKQSYNSITKQNEEQIKYVLFKIDKNNSGKIDLSQFISAVFQRKKLFIKKFLLEAFDYFDQDKTGYIELQQLQSLLKGCQQQQIQHILTSIDKNNDLKISKQEFLNYMQQNNFLY